MSHIQDDTHKSIPNNELTENKISDNNLGDNYYKNIPKKEPQTITHKLCRICNVKSSNTAPVPCGHKSFCYDCIAESAYLKPERGCLICGARITSIVRIIES